MVAGGGSCVANKGANPPIVLLCFHIFSPSGSDQSVKNNVIFYPSIIGGNLALFNIKALHCQSFSAKL